jgi:hypothetical protein
MQILNIELKAEEEMDWLKIMQVILKMLELHDVEYCFFYPNYTICIGPTNIDNRDVNGSTCNEVRC